MSINLALSFLTALIMFVYAGFVFKRYLVRRRLNYLFWGIGLTMFGIGSLAGAILAYQWSQVAFFCWYLFGAILTAAWIGQGTVYLLAKKKRANILTAVLLGASLIATLMLVRTMPSLDAGSFTTSLPISEQYKTMMPAIAEGGAVRLTTPFFNVYGLVTLVGGALYSAYLFRRKRVMPHLVVGNMLIAVGGLTVAGAGLLTRIGYGSSLYLGELLAATLMFAGFLIAAARPRRQPKERDAAPAAVG